tara:strand:- start:876 stop:1160 length:285 start_codon:yes stop_codon:yes gene_type:complete
MRKAQKIPQRVDEPPHILLWSADELAPLLLGIVFGMFLGELLICIILGFVVTQFYRRYRENHPDGFLLHILYHAGLPVTKGKSMVNPFIKRLLP